MPKCILIVDDNPVNMKMADYLLTQEGYQVRQAINGTQLYLALATCNPDLILMDVQLPDIDGLTLTRQLKAHPNWYKIPVVALTSYAMAGDEKRVMEAGCDGYLTKPIEIKKFLGQVQAFMKSSETVVRH